MLSYYPLAFLEDSGRNRTRDKLAADERKALSTACDEALRRSVALLAPAHLVVQAPTWVHIRTGISGDS